ncbi:MAG: DUF6377 domain-containing protein [Sphingobacteriia bacterium]|jgi:hypothetical protein
MKKILVSLLFSLFIQYTYAQSQEDSLFILIDKAIANRPDFASKKNLHIDSLKKAILNNSVLEEKFELNNTLFNEYKHYNLDSALQIAKNKKLIAFQLSNQNMQYQSEMNIAEMLGKMGMYKETFDLMGRINKSNLDKSLLPYYYHIFHSIYILLWQNALSNEEKLEYQIHLSQYKDSLLQVTDPKTLAFKLILSGKLVENKQYAAALEIMNQCRIEFGQNEPEKIMIANGFAEIYEKTGEIELEKKYLSIAALGDIKRAVKSYVALRKLAIVLFKEGYNLERAYNYIKCAMEDATYAKARFRMIEISEALPIITATYDIKMKEEKDILFKYLILISILSSALVVFIVLLFKQLRKISFGQRIIELKNDELLATNNQLKKLNKKLSEADQVKEAYIGYVFNLCSTYIDKLENYRVDLYTKLKSKQIDEVVRITGNSSLVTNEIREFLQNFDAVFLNIYPDFIEDFNNLLKDGEQIVPKGGDFLTPELRVFALVRLGITDSSKIAIFLHYSPQTVYNYKLKVKTKLAISKEEFLIRIHQIGNQKDIKST